MILYVLFAVLFVCAARELAIRRSLPKGTRRLPGPPGIPFIGRVYDIPRTHSYLRFKKWSDVYGPIYQINIFGVNHVWVSTDDAATDLLVKRGTIYSDRPSINNVKDSKTAGEYLPLLGYNDAWRRQRKFVHKIMAQSAAASHLFLPLYECRRFLTELLQDPTNYQTLTENYTGRVISQLAFGDFNYHEEVAIHSHALLGAISPANHLTNIIPQLKILPSWLSPWKMAEEARHRREREFFFKLRSEVNDKVKGDVALSSFMRTFLETQDGVGMSDEEGAYVIGMIGLAGLLTTASAMMTYILAMCLYPQWQIALQQEIDSVTGDRMPETSDAPRLPILRAVIKEIIRWRPVTPSSIPHETIKDDIYNGYFIPKGSHIHPSQWAITRDPAVYPDGDSFKPERWLEPSYPTYQEPLTEYPNIRNFTTFGYGRRICQGQDLVEAELLIGIGGMAWASTIRKKRDAAGRDIDLASHDYTSLLISRPKPFPFDLKPRSAKREQQVRDNWREAANSPAPFSGAAAGCLDEKVIDGFMVPKNINGSVINGVTEQTPNVEKLVLENPLRA